MPLKAATITPTLRAIALELAEDTSIANTDSQIIIQGQLQEIVNYL